MKSNTDDLETLIASRKTHRAIFYTVLTIFVVYLMTIVYIISAPNMEYNPLLSIGILVLFSGMIPSFMQLLFIKKKIQKR